MYGLVVLALMVIGSNANPAGAQFGGQQSVGMFAQSNGQASFSAQQPAAPLSTPAVNFGAPLPAAPVATSVALSAPLPSLTLPAAPIVQVKETFSDSYGQAFAPVVQTYEATAQAYGPIDAAVQTRRTVELRQVAYPQTYAQPQVIEVSADHMPVLINFRTASSPIQVQQTHTPGNVYPVEYANYEEEVHRVVNEVLKPVIQEVREVIQPYRRVTQEIRPVIEEVHTIVHKADGYRAKAPLPLIGAGYGPGAALVATKGYKAAKA